MKKLILIVLIIILFNALPPEANEKGGHWISQVIYEESVGAFIRAAYYIDGKASPLILSCSENRPDIFWLAYAPGGKINGKPKLQFYIDSGQKHEYSPFTLTQEIISLELSIHDPVFNEIIHGKTMFIEHTYKDSAPWGNAFKVDLSGFTKEVIKHGCFTEALRFAITQKNINN